MSSIPPIETFCVGIAASRLSKRPLPVAPDGEHDHETQADARRTSSQGHRGPINSIKRIKSKCTSSAKSDRRIVRAFLTALHQNAVDETPGGVFMDGIALLSDIPPASRSAKKMVDAAITRLYETIPHPAAASLGRAHAFRQADGGGNNPLNPDIGRAGTPYARSVQGKRAIATTALPNPGLVFDTLMRARDRKDHPGGNSSFTFAFAALMTHSLFRTNPADWSINGTSSYLDLSPLYGLDQATQDLVRHKAPGRGLLYPDTFSEDRLAFLPPAASAILVIMSRNHNYIADMLLKINDRGRWRNPPAADIKLRAQQDEEIFQTAKLVNCGHFMSLVIGDYMGGFLGLSEGTISPLFDNAFGPIKGKDGRTVERGQGNQCSVEFNILCRASLFNIWHPTISAREQEWTEEIFRTVFGKRPLDELTLRDFQAAFANVLAGVDPDPSKRTFGGIKRGEDGKFSDHDLATILQDATESPAGAFRARGTPGALRVLEVFSIIQARQWNVCTMNEFRQFLGLKQFRTFEEWNSDVDIANAARRLYGHINNLELYVGLQCEESMPLKRGVRFASGYTLIRAVLADTIAVVRGDRYYTTDFTPGNLTAWGFQDCQRDPRNGGFGGQMPKLLMRHLPRHYPFNSVYGCFPFFTPSKMKESLTTQGLASQYTFHRPESIREPKILHTLTGIKYVFNESGRFPPTHSMKTLGGGYGFFHGFEASSKQDQDRAWLMHALFPSQESLSISRAWYRDFPTQKIKERSWKYHGVPGNYIDIVKSVINATLVYWAAERLCGLSIKNEDNPSGLYTEQEVYDMFTVLSTYASIGNEDPETAFHLRWAAAQVAGVLQPLTAKNFSGASPETSRLSIPSIAQSLSKYHANNAFSKLVAHLCNLFGAPPEKPCHPFVNRLLESGRPQNQLVANVIGLAVASVNNARAAVHVVDFYLDDARSHERRQIIKLLRSDDDLDRDELLCGYVREAMRLNPECGGHWRDVTSNAVIPQGLGRPAMTVSAGDRIWMSLKNANLNPLDFARPTTVAPARSMAPHKLKGCPGLTYADQTITEIVKAVFTLKNVRRAPGNAGRLARFKSSCNETSVITYLTPDGRTSRWPGSMHLVYDD
ncbi:heme peroxidase [Mycena capillaripes]|nr:heme peroxidase [Mycena capillaripes]